jgi:hypothetical protein
MFCYVITNKDNNLKRNDRDIEVQPFQLVVSFLLIYWGHKNLSYIALINYNNFYHKNILMSYEFLLFQDF